MTASQVLHRFSLLVPASLAEWALAELADIVPEGFEEQQRPEGDTCFVCYALPEARESLRARLEALRSALSTSRHAAGRGVALHEETIPNQNWREAWKAHFRLQRIGRFVIRPSWIPYEPAQEELLIHLDPGSAFGSGLHATTQLCLHAQLTLSKEGRRIEHVLDFGAGTGILSLGACRLWSCTALAVDDDPLARQATEENAARNGCGHRIRVSAELPPPGQGGAPFDLVLANIQRPVLLRYAEALASLLGPGGVIVLSGLLRADEAPVSEAYSALGLRAVQAHHQGDWVAVRLERSGAGELTG